MIARRQSTPVSVHLPSFGISAFTSRHSPDFYMPVASHSFEKICFVDDGTGGLELSESTLELSEGMVVYVPANQLHRFYDAPGAPLSLSVLCLSPSAIARLLTGGALWQELVNNMPEARHLKLINSHVIAQYRRLFRSIVLQLGQERVGREAMAIALATELIVLVIRAAEQHERANSGRMPAAFAAAISEVDEHFAERLSVSNLAKKAGLSYRAYTGNFRRYTGMTVTQYLTARRIEFVKKRLTETGDIMGSALEAGFGDLSHFYRVFKRQVGYTPQAFISIHGGMCDC